MLFFKQQLIAQNTDSIIANVGKQMSYYRIKKLNASMFLHLDKTVYVNTETIWFAAYILNSPKNELKEHKVLSVALINCQDQSVQAATKFVMANGLCYGSIRVPDTIPAGNYNFIAYTNMMYKKSPVAFFSQRLTVKTAKYASFNAEMILDTNYHQPGKKRIMLSVRSSGRPVEGAMINYSLGKNVHTRVAGRAKTNVLGMYDIILPAAAVTSDQHMLELRVMHKNEQKIMHLNLPVTRRLNVAKFYPEGGNLIANLPCRVGVEIKTAEGLPLRCAAVVMENNKALDTIQTTDYGMAQFYLLPQQNVKYRLKLLDEQKTIYDLPQPLSQGVTVHLPNAIVNDTLHLQIVGNLKGKLFLFIHNYRQIFSAAQFNSNNKHGFITADLSNVPKGLNVITVLDSLQRPCAERLFFAHYNRRQSLNIECNETYKTRQQVTVKIKLNQTGKLTPKGLVSVACAQDNRFEIKNENNIEHYIYLQRHLADIPLKDELMGNGASDIKYLNELLLIKGWTRYKWPELMHTTSADTVRALDSLAITGTVTHFDDKVIEPLKMILMSDSLHMVMFDTDTKGAFTLPDEMITSKIYTDLHVLVSGATSEYTIQLKNPYADANKIFAAQVEPVVYQDPLVASTGNFVLTGFEHATNLREVKIKAGNDLTVYGANECGDYVCRYRILNCFNHPHETDNYPPVKGRLYQIHGLGSIIYKGCDVPVIKPGVLSFKGIYQAQEFYTEDYRYAKVTDNNYISTLFWKDQLLVNADNTAEVSFYTSDITGKFRIVVQGITGYDVVYGQKTFEVTKGR